MTPPIIFFIEGEIFFPLAFPCLKSFKFDPIKDKMFLPKRFINDVNLGKCELLAFDSSGAEYKVIHIENLGLKFNILDFICFAPFLYNVSLKLEKIKEYGFEEFKERVLGLEKESARKCKQEGYDSQTEAYTISKLLKAKSPEEIIKVF